MEGQKMETEPMELRKERDDEQEGLFSLCATLLQHPLYRHAAGDRIHVMVVGFGHYSRKFLDLCLQVGQMRGWTLDVMVVSDSDTDQELYFRDRPELPGFFMVDGVWEREENPYGELCFSPLPLSQDSRKNAELLQDVLLENHERKPVNYIFVSLGEDALSLAAALACKSAADVLETPCTVCCVREDDGEEEFDCGGLVPVLVNQAAKEHPLYGELERMAFNVHLVWEKNLNVDFADVKESFHRPYNHTACLLNVVSVKYKLYSLGINWDSEESGNALSLYERATRAAGAFQKKCLEDDSREGLALKNEVICAEHRRWVVEKLCDGWRKLEDLEQCMGGETKNADQKRHVCLVTSSPREVLGGEYRKPGHGIWDKGSEEDLKKLDELDRLSVRLHRLYRERADQLNVEELLSGETMERIRSLVREDRRVSAAFQEWYTCLKDIRYGDSEKVYLYEGLKEALLRTAEDFDRSRRETLEREVVTFEKSFYPVLGCNAYRDFKQEDRALVENIPFILTYSDSTCMVIPYHMGGSEKPTNTELFSNVAAPMVVWPESIIYLCYVEEPGDLIRIGETLPSLESFMAKKRFRAAVEFVLLYAPQVGKGIGPKLEKEFQSCMGRIRGVYAYEVGDEEEIAPILGKVLEERREGWKVFAVERNKTYLSAVLQGAGFYRTFRSYRFHSATQHFTRLSDCDVFSYIHKSPYITVGDMAAFKQSISESIHQPEFFEDYTTLWNEYVRDNVSWKALCKNLGTQAQEDDVLVSFKKNSIRSCGEHLEYLLPVECQETVEKIFEFLEEKRILQEDVTIEAVSGDSCRVTVEDDYGYQAYYDCLFSQPRFLTDFDAITCQFNTDAHIVTILYDRLEVGEVDFARLERGANAQERIRKQVSLLKFFERRGYIQNLRQTLDSLGIQKEAGYSFTYTNASIKGLLTMEGRILEVYTYHKAKEIGKFDDVVSGYEISWKGTEVRSEFDCILTKGFNTLFVECKATKNIKQEYYHKLESNARYFGINVKIVLIADTREREYYDHAPVNAMQRDRGEMMDVITIWKPDEIANIGYTLLRIINGTYTVS